MLQIFRYILCIFLIAGFTQVLTADSFTTQLESQKINLPGVNNLGENIAFNGDTLLTTARTTHALIDTSYVFIRSGNTWIQQAQFAPDAGENFISIALEGDTAVVTSQQNETAAVYFFVRSAGVWTRQSKLILGGTSAGGVGSAAIDGDTALVIHYEDGPGFEFIMTVYTFTRSANVWTEQDQMIIGSSSENAFGRVALDGNTALISATHENAAYVYGRSGNTWTLQATLTPSDGVGPFGNTVAIEGNTAVVGSIGDEAVYVFKFNGTTWTEQQKLSAVENGLFGHAVAIDGNAIVIGAYDTNIGRGSAYVYVEGGSGWTLQNRLLPSGNTFNRFGYAVGIQGTTALIGTQIGDEIYVYPQATVGSPTEELLVNGSFEVDANNDFVPDGWTRKNANGDGRRCNQPGQPPRAYEGECAFLFKGAANADVRLTQNVDLNVHDLNAGNTIRLTGFYNKQGSGSVYVRLFVSYANLPEDQAQIVLTQTTSGYQPVNPLSITLKAEPTRVRVQIQNKTTSGKTWFDAMSLQKTSGGSTLIPLP
jgi:hypothetical protein